MEILSVVPLSMLDELTAIEQAAAVVCERCGRTSSGSMDIPHIAEQLWWAKSVIPYGGRVCFLCFLALTTREQNELLANRWLHTAGVPLAEVGARFHNFQRSTENTDSLYTLVKNRWYDNPELTFLALLSSQKGIGKTHLAISAMAEYFVEHADIYRKTKSGHLLPTVTDKTFLFVKERDLTMKIRESYMDGAEFSEKQVMDEVYTVDFLVVDDIMSNKQSDFDRQIFLNIIDHRMDMPRKRTIFTSNKSRAEIAKMDDRISSRFADVKKGFTLSIETMVIPDYREQRKSAEDGSSGVLIL